MSRDSFKVVQQELFDKCKLLAYHKKKPSSDRQDLLRKQELDLKHLADQLEKRVELLNKEKQEHYSNFQEETNRLKVMEENLQKRESMLEREYQEKLQDLEDREWKLEEKRLLLERFNCTIVDRESEISKKEDVIIVKEKELEKQILTIRNHEETLVTLEQKLTDKIDILTDYQEKLLSKYYCYENEDNAFQSPFQQQQLEQEIQNYYSDLNKLQQKENKLSSYEQLIYKNT